MFSGILEDDFDSLGPFKGCLIMQFLELMETRNNADAVNKI